MRTEATRILVVTAVLALFAVQGVTAQDAQDDLPTVAVMDFTGFMVTQAGNSAPLGKAVSAMLVTELITRDGLRVIERNNLQDLLMEQRLSLSGRVDESTALEVGRLVGAQYVILGQVTSVMSSVRMDMRAVDVETSEILEVQKLTDEIDGLLDMVVRIADLFTLKLELTPPAGRPVIAQIPVRATIEFSRGVDFEDNGEVEQALAHYQAALEIHPDHAGAKMAVERLESHGGIDR